MKKSLLFVLLLTATVSAFSQDDEQKTFKFGLGTSLSLPVGDLKTGTKYGVGFELQADYNFSEHLSAFLQSGVDVFKTDSYYDGDNLLNVPIIVGPRLKANGFFVGAGVGYGLWNSSGGSSNGFLYSPQLGYEVEHYQFLAHYTSTSVKDGSLSYFGIKVFRTF